MSDPNTVDDVLVKWGERLFYPRVRFQDSRTPRLALPSSKDRAAYFRARIEATMLRRAPQVMVKVTGGGRGMKAIAAHFRYISKHGKLEMEDEFGRRSTGKEAVNDVLDEWRMGGTAIDDVGIRREALNIMLSMPSGTDPGAVVTAARAFAKAELMDHRYREDLGCCWHGLPDRSARVLTRSCWSRCRPQPSDRVRRSCVR